MHIKYQSYIQRDRVGALKTKVQLLENIILRSGIVQTSFLIYIYIKIFI